MVHKPLHNIQSFLSSKPPVVVFIFCLGMMAIACISFSYHISINDVHNPDVDFSELDSLLVNIIRPTLFSSNLNDEIEITPTNYENTTAISLLMMANIKEIENISALNNSFLVHFNKTTMSGATNPYYPMRFSVVDSSNTSVCESEKECSLLTCVTLFVPEEIASTYPHHDESCPNGIVPDASKESFMYMAQNKTNGMNMKFELPLSAYQFYIELSPETKSIIGIRLMNSSYILFVAILIILVLGFIRSGKPQQHKDGRQPLL
jgi:hypothetical protein